jgi:outer membrane protein assembly factor BamB
MDTSGVAAFAHQDARLWRAKLRHSSRRFIMAGRVRRASIAVLPAVICLVASGALTTSARGDDNWPQWRGPAGTGAASAAKTPVEWSESKNIKWKVKIPGEGTSTPIIWGNQVFIQTAIPTGKKVEAAAANADAPPAASATAAQNPPAEQSSSSSLLDRFDVNKDGKISRSEVPEGTLRRIFDRIVEQYKLDAEKTYTRAELEKIMGVSASPESRPSGENRPGQGNQPPQRRPGGGGPGGFGGGRGGRPTEPFQFVIICLDRQTGKVIWQQVACEQLPHEGHHPDGSFAAASPVTDGKHVLAYFGSRGLYCYDMKGELKWSQDFGDQRMQNGFGEGTSPTLHGDTVIINWDHEGGSFIIALNKNTGDTLWKKSRDERSSWSTPIIVEHDGKFQVVTTATNKIRSYDLASGELIWECSGLTSNTIPSPVSADGMVYATSGFRGNALLAIRLGRTGDLTNTDAIVWKHGRSTPYVPSPLLYGDKLYLFASNNAVLSCFDVKSGRALIEAQRLQGIQGVYASPVGAGGKIYLVGREGGTIVLKESDKLDVLATNRLPDRFDASPAIAGNDLYLRGRESLYCIAEK